MISFLPSEKGSHLSPIFPYDTTHFLSPFPFQGDIPQRVPHTLCLVTFLALFVYSLFRYSLYIIKSTHFAHIAQ